MKNLSNHHSPKEDSWEKIMAEVSFEKQLTGHLSNLPQYEPEGNTWEKIVNRLDEKHKIVLWPYFGIAATLIGGLLLSTLLLTKEELSISSFDKQHELTQIEELEIPFELTKPTKESLEPKRIASTKPRLASKAQVKNQDLPQVSISLPEIDLIATNKEIILPEKSDIDPENKNISNPKTLHEVTISWGIKANGFQVKTSFGKQDPSTLESKQTGSISRSKRIRIGDKN